MLPLAHTGLTTPVVAGPGCNEWLGLKVERRVLKAERRYCRNAVMRTLCCASHRRAAQEGWAQSETHDGEPSRAADRELRRNGNAVTGITATLRDLRPNVGAKRLPTV